MLCWQVQVLDYKERAAPAKDLVQVAVYVEHDSQKGIMVGRGGSALKAMATAARADIEAFVGELQDHLLHIKSSRVCETQCSISL